MRTALLHIFIAITWLFLSPNRDLPRLIIGILIGWGLIALLQPVLPRDRYLRGSVGFFKWIWSFISALVASQVRVATIILLPRRNPIHPGFLEFPIDGLNDVEIILLSHSISLTPGTTTVEVDKANGQLLIHALEAGDPEATKSEIELKLLKPLMAFTRP